MASLRTRLYLYLLIAIVPLLVGTGLVTGFAFTVWAEQEFDHALEAKAMALVTLTEWESNHVEFEFAGEFMPEFETSVSPQYFELWLEDGILFERSESFARVPAARDARLFREPAQPSAPRFRDVRLPDGRWGRQIQIDFVPQIGELTDPAKASDQTPENLPSADTQPAQTSALTVPASQIVTLVVTRERETLDRQNHLLYIWFATAALIPLVALTALIRWLLRSALRPLDSLVEQVRALDADSLGRRIRISAAPREIAPVIDQLNGLLHRVEGAFRRERQMSSDIAHELKTPVAELRNLCEVVLRFPEDSDGVREFFGDARNIALHMDRLVTQLLVLARYEEGRQHLQFSSVAVAGALDAAWRPLAEAATSKDIVLHNDVPDTLRLETDPDLFMLIATNLLSNAVAHGVAGSAVRCRSSNKNGRLSICIANQSDDLEADDLKVMFDRFWRKDEARSGGRNVGLDLPLVRAFAGLLDFAIEPDLDVGGILRICLVRMAAADAPRHAAADATAPG